MEYSTLFVLSFMIVIAVSYAILSKCIQRRNENDKVIAVEAGPSDEASPEVLAHLSKEKPSYFFTLEDNRKVCSSAFLRVLIVGSCMKPRKVLNGEEWLAEPIDPTKDDKLKVKPRDILVIYIPDKNIFKIREFKEWDSNNELLHTLYYTNDGTKRCSSRPHAWENVKGILRYSV